MWERMTKYRMQAYGDEGAIEWSKCEWDTYWNEEGEVIITQEAEA